MKTLTFYPMPANTWKKGDQGLPAILALYFATGLLATS